LITHNSGSASSGTTNIEANLEPEAIEKKKVELLQQEIQQEPEITQEQLSIGKRLLNWRTIVPLVIVIVALAYFAKQANIDPQKTWTAIRTANIVFVLIAFAIYYLSFPIRTLRWQMLLQNIGYTKSNGVHLPKFAKLLEILYISWFANVIVPAKLGDLYRAYLLRKETQLPASRTFGTVLAERLLDLIVLLLLFIPAVIISLHENLPVTDRPGGHSGSRLCRYHRVICAAHLPHAHCQPHSSALPRSLQPFPGRDARLIPSCAHTQRFDSWGLGL